MNDEKPDLKDGRILLVEDDFVNGKIISRLLEMDNIPTDWVKNGKEAIDFYLQNKDSVLMVFMDLQMPIIDGYKATVALRENGFKRPIIAMTANAYCDEKTKSKEAGMNDYISKPVSKMDLFMMIEKWVNVDKK
ncbi:response regulator [Labilibaculum sp. DW002]|uniref:Response regulator n=1 Tax=Paralabilibaculum antarcticum TaxID=2912572 RepID=A0ABT5VPD6_9BACT|nr:response regulator [Labilibaculum sp. DW002]MDE5417136.1 response regulator [Labilibaculum sp. DW002]